LPVFVEDDGSFIADDVRLGLDDYVFMISSSLHIVPIHETAEMLIISAGKGCYGPYARWFNDGAANWITRKIISERWPEYAALQWGEFFPVDGERSSVNLLAWPQLSYGLALGKADSVAYYGFSAELMGRLFDGLPEDSFARVVRAVTRRNVRRVICSDSIVRLLLVRPIGRVRRRRGNRRRPVNRFANAQVGPATTQVAGHRHVDVPVGRRVTQIDAGGSSCALLDTGAVRCWGPGFAGQLGYGNTRTIGDDETPASAGDVPVL
jgi:hypothetical protein